MLTASGDRFLKITLGAPATPPRAGTRQDPVPSRSLPPWHGFRTFGSEVAAGRL